MGFFCSAGILGGVLFARGLVVAEDVAAAAAGLQERLAGFFAEFAAEPVYVDFDQVGKGVKGLVPDMFGDFRPADDAAGVAREIFKERVFLGGEGNGARAALGGLRSGVEFEIADDDARGAEFVGAAEQGAQAGEEFAEFEGLGEVIVGASRPVMRSSTPSFAVSIRMGVRLPPARMALQTAKPSIPGIMTSRTIKS
jgi:hypothetical protein